MSGPLAGIRVLELGQPIAGGMVAVGRFSDASGDRPKFVALLAGMAALRLAAALLLLFAMPPSLRRRDNAL